MSKKSRGSVDEEAGMAGRLRSRGQPRGPGESQSVPTQALVGVSRGRIVEVSSTSDPEGSKKSLIMEWASWLGKTFRSPLKGVADLGGEIMHEWIATQGAPGLAPLTAQVHGLALDDPAAASTGYGDQLPDGSSDALSALQATPESALSIQDVADAAAEMVASADVVSTEPDKSETVEGQAQSGAPPRSESQTLPESDMEGSFDLGSDSEASQDDEYEDTEVGDTRDQVPDTSPPSGEGVIDEREEQVDVLEVDQANCLIKMFHDRTSRIVEEGMLDDRTPEDIAIDYVNQIADYHNELRSTGWHDHKLIKAAGIMEYTPSVEEMKKAIARKKEAMRGMQEKMWKEASEKWQEPQLLRTLDSYTLPRGVVLQKVLEVSSDEP